MFLFSFALFFQLLRVNRLANGLKATNEQIKKFAMDTGKAVLGGQFAFRHFHVDPHSLISVLLLVLENQEKKKKDWGWE